MNELVKRLARYPVPAYGLACPVCRRSLDGAPSDKCPECDVEFDLERLIVEALEGHRQQTRREAIRVLATEAAPDCPIGSDLIRFYAMSDTYSLEEAVAVVVRVARQRQEGLAAGAGEQGDAAGESLEARALAAPPGRPFLTGYELPIPDMGWHCPKCDYPLRGLPRHLCPECGTPFDPTALLGDEPTVVLCVVNSEVEYALVRSVLEERQIPHMFQGSDVLADTLRLRVASRRRYGRMTVPREFYFDAVFWLRRAQESGRPVQPSDEPEPPGLEELGEGAETSEDAGPDWICPNCGESVPDSFDMCWSCCTMRP
jgi:rubrerythrin